MIRYYNSNTGDLAEYDKPNDRLEGLPNWRRLAEDETPPQGAARDGVLSRPQLRVENPVRVLTPPDGGAPIMQDGERGTPADARTEGQPTVLATTEDGTDEAPVRPADDAPLQDWRDYAAKVAPTPEAQADVTGMTREQLVAAYGGEAEKAPAKRAARSSSPAKRGGSS